MAGGLKALAAICAAASWTAAASAAPDLLARQSNATVLSYQNATLPYQDATLSVEDRVEDLLARMTLVEKVGQLFQQDISVGTNGTLAGPTDTRNSTEVEISEKFMSHFNIGGMIYNVTQTAEWHNRLQQAALDTRLGIPISLSSDPRHSTTQWAHTWFPINPFSQWPETLGLSALRDPVVTRQFAETAREEYKAIGVRVALHPQVDLSTEYRWARVFQTMGENATLTSELVVAYIEGFQGKEMGPESVGTATKHFPGGGPVENGEDSHFVYGKNATYPGHNMEHHLIPFKAAIAAGTRQMIPYYSRPIKTEYEEVAFGFNKGILQDLLREQLGFDGIICSDWGLITDGEIAGQDMPARAWGVENLSEVERAALMLEAGVDQIGGEERTELIVQLVDEGTVTVDRIDFSVRKLLREKFVLGLFDEKRFISVENASKIVGNTEFQRLANQTQRASYTLLKNEDNILPIRNPNGMKVYIDGFQAYHLDGLDVEIVDTPEEADIALVRLPVPFVPRPGGFESIFTAGSLEFNATEQARQAAIYSAVPTIVDMTLTRPAAIPEIVEKSAAIIANYGTNIDAMVDVVFGIDGAQPKGKLPFDMPRSTAAVEDSFEDVQFDTANPVFRYGHGLSYKQ